MKAAIITGDIINSTGEVKESEWLKVLKKVLSKAGKTPSTWEIFRGDSFQVIVKDATKSLEMALLLKTCLKMLKNIDVRMGIGIGEISYKARKVTQSNGEAFINSGAAFDAIEKEKQTILIKTGNKKIDKELNLLLRLYLIPADAWTPGNAELMKVLMENKGIKQVAIAKKLKIKQSSVSSRYSGTYYKEMLQINTVFENKINVIINEK